MLGSAKSGVDTCARRLGRRTDSRLNARLGELVELGEDDPTRSEVVEDRDIPLEMRGGTTVDEPDEDDRVSENGSVKADAAVILRSAGASSLMAVTSRLPSSPPAADASLLDRLVLFGNPRPRPVLERVDRDSMTDHRLVSFCGVCPRRLSEPELWSSLLTRISTGDAVIGARDGVAAAEVVPPDTRRVLGVR